MASQHSDREFWKTEVEHLGNLATTDPKQDVVHNETIKSNEDPDFKLVGAPFEEKTEEEKKLVRKIDMYLMPTIWVLYCFSYMVRPVFSLNLIHVNYLFRTELLLVTRRSLVWTEILV